MDKQLGMVTTVTKSPLLKNRGQKRRTPTYDQPSLAVQAISPANAAERRRLVRNGTLCSIKFPTVRSQTSLSGFTPYLIDLSLAPLGSLDLFLKYSSHTQIACEYRKRYQTPKYPKRTRMTGLYSAIIMSLGFDETKSISRLVHVVYCLLVLLTTFESTLLQSNPASKENSPSIGFCSSALLIFKEKVPSRLFSISPNLLVRFWPHFLNQKATWEFQNRNHCSFAQLQNRSDCNWKSNLDSIWRNGTMTTMKLSAIVVGK